MKTRNFEPLGRGVALVAAVVATSLRRSTALRDRSRARELHGGPIPAFVLGVEGGLSGIHLRRDGVGDEVLTGLAAGAREDGVL